MSMTLVKQKFTGTQHNFDQRFAVLEKNVGAILRSQYAGINVAFDLTIA